MRQKPSPVLPYPESLWLHLHRHSLPPEVMWYWKRTDSWHVPLRRRKSRLSFDGSRRDQRRRPSFPGLEDDCNAGQYHGVVDNVTVNRRCTLARCGASCQGVYSSRDVSNYESLTNYPRPRTHELVEFKRSHIFGQLSVCLTGTLTRPWVRQRQSAGTPRPLAV